MPCLPTRCDPCAWPGSSTSRAAKKRRTFAAGSAARVIRGSGCAELCRSARDLEPVDQSKGGSARSALPRFACTLFLVHQGIGFDQQGFDALWSCRVVERTAHADGEPEALVRLLVARRDRGFDTPCE